MPRMHSDDRHSFSVFLASPHCHAIKNIQCCWVVLMLECNKRLCLMFMICMFCHSNEMCIVYVWNECAFVHLNFGHLYSIRCVHGARFWYSGSRFLSPLSVWLTLDVSSFISFSIYLQCKAYFLFPKIFIFPALPARSFEVIQKDISGVTSSHWSV